MPATTSVPYFFDIPRALVVVTFIRDPTFHEWLALMNEIFLDETFRPGFGFLIDRRNALIPETKDVRAISAFIDEKERTGETKGWALVVSDLGSYGMGRMAEQLSNFDNSLRVFREIEQAFAWLEERMTVATTPRFSQNQKFAGGLPSPALKCAS